MPTAGRRNPPEPNNGPAPLPLPAPQVGTGLNENEPTTVQELKDSGYEIMAEFPSKQTGASFVLTKGATVSKSEWTDTGR